MSQTLLIEKLSWFKQNEKPEAVLMIADNPELIKIIIAWSNIEVKLTDKISGLAGDSENDLWEWLWENAKFSLTELKPNTGVAYSESVLEQKTKLLIGNRILYPDGSINSFVQRYLRGEVAKLFELKPKKTRKTGEN